jgi:hypothetical protein
MASILAALRIPGKRVCGWAGRSLGGMGRPARPAVGWQVTIGRGAAQPGSKSPGSGLSFFPQDVRLKAWQDPFVWNSRARFTT